MQTIRTSLVVLAAVFAAAAAPPRGLPAWPNLSQQLEASKAPRGSALEALIAANQDFGLLRADEAKDSVRVPPWLRVLWRRAHPEGRYSADDPTGGYPFVLKEVHEWMVSHPDLVPGIPEADHLAVPDPDAELESVEAFGVSAEQRISGLQSAPRSESDIRVNPWNPLKIIGGSNNISGSGQQAQFWSTDGGVTWSQNNLPLQPGDAFHSDPTVDWTSDGTAWSTTIGINGAASVLQMRAYKSLDSGATWTFDSTFSGAQSSADKQMMWVDHSATSPYKDSIYLIWHNGAPAFVNRRTPAGVWGSPVQVSGAESTGTAIGSDIKTNANGDVFGFWPTTGNRRIIVIKSTDGGASWGTPVQIANTFDSFDIGVPSFAGRRILIYTSGGAYRTATRNLVYVTWTDLTGAAGCTAAANEPGTNVASTCKTRVWFARSTDGGGTWSVPAMVNNQASLNDQFNQWLAVDETTGALALIYYDTVGDAGRKKVDIWYQSSFDDGATWSAATKVTSAMTDESIAGADSGNQFGDYNGLSGIAGSFFPSWTDRRNAANEEIWTARIDDLPCEVPGAPAIGTATATAPNQVQVTWGQGAPLSTAFDVQRATGTCAAPGTFANIASALAGSPYTDSTVSGGTTYAYRVVGRIEQCASTPSGCVQATATGACTLPPTFAGLTSATSAGTAVCGVGLAWSAGSAACSGPLTYSVYRSPASGFSPGPGTLIASGVSGSGYADADALTSGTTYYYIVRATDSANAVAETNSVQRSAAPQGPVSTTTMTETFEGAGGFDLTGWSHAVVSGTTDWTLSTAQSHTPTHSWRAQSQASASDRVLVSPPFIVEAGSTLAFRHTFDFEMSGGTCWDGGTLEISQNAGATWTVLPDAAFTAGGFTGTVGNSSSNPIGGRRAWCDGNIGAMTSVTATLGAFASASETRLRWHAGDDVTIANTGWFVDSVTLGTVGAAAACNVQWPGFNDGFETGVLPGAWVVGP